MSINKKKLLSIFGLTVALALPAVGYAGQSVNSINGEANGIFYKYLHTRNKVKSEIKKGDVVIPKNDLNPSNAVIPGEKYVYKHGGLSSFVQNKREKVYFSSLENKTAKYVGELMPSPANTQGQIFTDQWIYIFMSSSVPKAAWHNYAFAINKMRQNHIVMVMRGCIGGCTGNNMVKTAMFIKNILHFHGVYLTAPVIIDPYLFRFYKVKRVPEFVYAKKVNPYNPSITMGYAKNLKNKPEWWKVKGDFSLNYNLKKLEKESKSVRLKAIRHILNRSFFSN